jgi:Holliday junction resolvasome RuvABC endonuclease subunit
VTILAVDPGLATLGWAIVEPGTGDVHTLGVRLSPPGDRDVGKNESRARRLEQHARELVQICIAHGVKRIVAEQVSLPPRGAIDVHAAAFLTWGMLVGVAIARGLERPRAIAPATWQAAVVPDRAARKARGYDAIESALERFVGGGRAAFELAGIPASHRNHALDAVGVGVCWAMRPELFDAAPKKPAPPKTAKRKRAAKAVTP